MLATSMNCYSSFQTKKKSFLSLPLVGPATPRPARQQAPRPPGSAGQPARPMTPGTPQGTLVRPMGNGPRPARNSNPRPPRPPRIQQGPAATLTRAQGQAPPRQYAPHSQRYVLFYIYISVCFILCLRVE